MKLINTLIQISNPPAGNLLGKEALDLALVCAAFEQHTTLVFVDRGVQYLRNDLNPQLINEKNRTAQINGLEFYDIKKVIAENESLDALGLQPAQLQPGVTCLNRKQINELVKVADYRVIL